MRKVKRVPFRWTIGIAFLLGLAAVSPADTPVSGTISTDTTWTLAGSPYIVTGRVYVYGPANPVLTIEPGVMVRFNSNAAISIGPDQPGTLYAVGTAGQPIVFTANSASPTPGFWRGVQLAAQASAASQISYATVSYGGEVGYSGGVDVRGSSPTLDNLTVQDNAHSGVSVNGGSPLISNSILTANPVGLWAASGASPSLENVTISNSATYPLSFDGSVTLGAVSALTLTGNPVDAIALRSGSQVSATWKNIGLPYHVLGEVSVSRGAPPSAVLTIEPGITIKFNANASLTIARNGELQAIGTSGNVILFTANSATPGPGYWRTIRFVEASAGSRIAFATVEYAGAPSFYGGIHIEWCSPTIENTTLRNHAYAAITVQGSAGTSPLILDSAVTTSPWGIRLAMLASLTVQNSTISNNTSGGILVQAPSILSLDTVAITDNSGFAISVDGKTTLGTISGLTATGNSPDAVELRGGLVDVNTIWKLPGLLPYVVTGDLSVTRSLGPAPTLTIDPGVIVKFNAARYFQIGDATLQAVGTSGQPIVFTANTASPTPGFWQGVSLGSQTAASSRIAYATVEYGGNAAWGGIHLERCSPTIENTISRNNRLAGITINGPGASPSIRYVTVQNHAVAGMRVNGGSPTIANSFFSNNTAGLINTTPATPVAARFNFWDAVSGPSGQGSGTGQSVSAGVSFEPWLAAAPSSPQFFSSYEVINRRFNPTVDPVTANFGSALSGDWTVKILNTSETVLRTYTGTGATGSVAWDGRNGGGTLQPSGTYTMQFESVAPGPAEATRARSLALLDMTLDVHEFTASQSAYQLNNAVGGTLTYTSNVPLTCTETLVIKDAAGLIVRTLVSDAVRALGTYSDIWDGRNDSGQLVQDGPYFYVVTVTRPGGPTFVWDRTGTPRSPLVTHTLPIVGATFAPFNNQPLVFTYALTDAYRVCLVVGGPPFGPDCSSTGYTCLTNSQYQASGTYSFTWAGVDSAGLMLSLQLYSNVILRHDNFPQNAVVVFGKAPALSSPTFAPALYSPLNGTQTLNFNLTSYQSQPVTLTVRFLNHGSGSVLRNMTIPGQAPGSVNVTWDGRADNGMRVAPGGYTAIITATDSLGDIGKLQAVTRVAY